MKNNKVNFFEEVGTIVKERVGDGQLTKEQFQEVSTTRTLVAGFPSTETKVKTLSDEEIEKKQQRVKQYLQSESTLEDELHELGVKPIAMIPVKLLKQLFAEFKIIDLGKIKNGRAKASQENVENAVSKLSNVSPWIIIAGSIVLFLMVIGLYVSIDIVGAITAAFITLVCGSILLAGVFFATKPKNKKIVGVLWPDYQASGSKTIQVAFPKLPESLQPILDKLNPMKDRICIAAAPGAITVNIEEYLENSKQSESQAWQQEIAEQRIRRQFLKDDPIAYIPSKDGSVGAVMFQFGHFPREKELIERVRGMSYSEMFSYF